MRRFIAYGPAFVVLLTSLVVLFAAPTLVRRVGYANTSYQIKLTTQALDEDDILERINRAVRAIAVATEPSVVHIEARRDIGNRMQEGSTGSGWVYDLDGHIVTNAHVIRDAETFFVHFFDGRVVDAELVGRDIYTDIAVLKVNTGEGLFPARRASRDEYQQGDRVFAFGSPFGFKFSMTQGIISGLGRNPNTAIEIGGYTNFIQTDAAVNPGNSGGPLIDVNGGVIGMNVAIATGRDSNGSTEGQSSGISFAIPIGTIDSVVPQLINTGEVTRGYLGIQYDPRSLWPIENGPYAVGVRVNDVVEGFPGDKAGLMERDVIAEINGQRVTSSDILRSVIATTAPGQAIDMRVWRDGAIEDLKVILAEFPEQDLVRQSLEQYGITLRADPQGRVVVSIRGFRSTAWRHGFREGMQIIRVGGRSVRSPDDVIDRLVSLDFQQGNAIDVQVLPSTNAEPEDAVMLEFQYTRELD